MIGVLTASTNSGSVLGYDMGDLKSKNQRIQVLYADGVFLDDEKVDRLNENWTDSDSLREFKRISRAVASDLARQFDQQAALSERVVRTTGHIALSFSPADRDRLTDEIFKIEIAMEYLELMGIVDTQWVLTEHFDTNAPHMHIAYNRVKFDGTVIDSKNERYRSMQVAAQLTEKYGLAKAGEAPRRAKSLPSPQLPFEQMRRLAREALSQSCTMDEFRARLRFAGIALRESEHSEQAKSYGLSYALIDHPEISAKGSKLDRSALSYAKVMETLNRNMAAREMAQKQAAEQRARDERDYAFEKGYAQLAPTFEKLDAAVAKAFDLYNETKKAGVAIYPKTDEAYAELKQCWNEIRQLTKERVETKSLERYIGAIGGIMILLNPLAALLVLAIGTIISDINLSALQHKKGALLSRIDELRTDIDCLKAQKAQIKIAKPEYLNQYLQARDKRNEFQEGLKKINKFTPMLREEVTYYESRPKTTKDFVDEQYATERRLTLPATESKPKENKEEERQILNKGFKHRR